MTSKAFSLLLAITLAACGSKPAPQQPQPPGGADATGTLTGTIQSIGPACAPSSAGSCDNPMAGYEITILASDGTTAVTTVKTGDDGTYSVELPPGNYVLLTHSGLRLTDEVRTNVTVSRDALARVDLTVDTGVR